jgi:hypothetical protein
LLEAMHNDGNGGSNYWQWMKNGGKQLKAIIITFKKHKSQIGKPIHSDLGPRLASMKIRAE